MEDLVIQSIESIDAFTKVIVEAVTSSITSSINLQNKIFFDDYIPKDSIQYERVLQCLSLKLLNNIELFSNNLGNRLNIKDIIDNQGIDGAFNSIVELNDVVCNKGNKLIESIERPHVNELSTIIVEYTNEHKEYKHQRIIKLLSSLQVERPQNKFSKKPDNSNTHFRPILTRKPNALTSLVCFEDSTSEAYSHPYEHELNQLQLSDDYKENLTLFIMPPSLDESPFVYVDTVKALLNVIETIKFAKEVAVDVEYHHVRSYLGLTCFIQLSTRTVDYIIDTISLRDNLEILNEVLTDPAIIKVFHGANRDIMSIQRDFGLYVVNMFDIGQACLSLKFRNKSLSYLLDTFCGIKTDRSHHLIIDWRIRPLSPELITFARMKSHYLLYIHDKLKKNLNDCDLITEVFHASNNICRLLYHKPTVNHTEHLLSLHKTNKVFNTQQLHALDRLWTLRDTIARDEDESPLFVLSDSVLILMAETLPQEITDVLSCCNQSWKLPLLRKYVYDFHKICVEASNANPKNLKRRSNVLDWLINKPAKSSVECKDTVIDIGSVKTI